MEMHAIQSKQVPVSSGYIVAWSAVTDRLRSPAWEHFHLELASTSAKPCFRQATPSFLDFGDPSGTVPAVEETLSHADNISTNSWRADKPKNRRQFRINYESILSEILFLPA